MSELTITATATDASGRVATASVTVDVMEPDNPPNGTEPTLS